MNIFAWPGIVMLLGLLIYLGVPDPVGPPHTRWRPRLIEIGRIAFFVGLLVVVLRASSRALLDL